MINHQTETSLWRYMHLKIRSDWGSLEAVRRRWSVFTTLLDSLDAAKIHNKKAMTRSDRRQDEQ